MEKKEEKKGFWASLFTPKTCSCSCESNIMNVLSALENKENKEEAAESAE